MAAEPAQGNRLVRMALIATVSLGIVLVSTSSGQRGLAATTVAAADQTYTDETGDSRGRLDVRTVRVTSSGDRLDVRVNLVQKTIQPTEHTGITFDWNNDGRGELQFYFDGTGGGSLRHVRLPGGGFEVTPASTGTVSNNDFGITFNLRLGALGNPARFWFWAFTKERDEPTVWDFAPSSGRWAFEVQGSTPPPPPPPPANADFAPRGSAMSPNPPRAGDVVGVGTSFRYRSTGKPVRGGRLACQGSIGPKRVRGQALRDSGLHACFFRIPATAGGSLFVGRVTLAVGGRERSVERRGVIVDASAMQLTRLSTRSGSGPGDPVAGQNFSANVSVAIVRPGSAPRQIRDGGVKCQATVGGKRLGAAYHGWFAGKATCSWNVPASARGSIFQGTITVAAGGISATKTFTGRVR